MRLAALALFVVADPGWLELRWPEVAGCPTGAEVAAAAERLTPEGPRRPVVAEASIAAGEAGYALDLRLRVGEEVEHRQARHADCRPLAAAAAVILAVAAAPDEPEPAPIPARDDEVPPGLRRPPPAATVEPPALGVFAAVVGAIGPPRALTPGVQAGLLVLWPRLRLELRFHHSFAAPLRYAGTAGAGADLSLSAGAARVCPRRARGGLSLHLCAGVELGALTARGVGLLANGRSTGLWAAGVFGPGAQWQPLGWLALGVDVEAAAAITRRTYTAADAASLLYVVPPVGMRLAASVALFFF